VFTVPNPLRKVINQNAVTCLTPSVFERGRATCLPRSSGNMDRSI
jgi:hypothetical protein